MYSFIIWHLSFYSAQWTECTYVVWDYEFKCFGAIVSKFSEWLEIFIISCRKPCWINTKLLFVHMVDIMPNRNKYFWDIRTGQAFHANDNVFKDVYVHSIHIFFSRGGPKIVLTEFCLFLTLHWLFNLNCRHKLTSCGLSTYPTLLFIVVFEWPLNQAFLNLQIRIAIGQNFGKDQFLVANLIKI